MSARLTQLLSLSAEAYAIGRRQALAGLPAPVPVPCVSSVASAAHASGYARGRLALANAARADSVDYFVMLAQARLRAHGTPVRVRAADPLLMAW